MLFKSYLPIPAADHCGVATALISIVRSLCSPVRRPGPLTALLGALLSSGAQADGVTNTSHAELAQGEHIARLICSSCHIVATDQEFPPILNWPEPSFFDIANRPGVTLQSLERFISETHWDTDKLPMTMPSPLLTKGQRHAVALYILSLRSQ